MCEWRSIECAGAAESIYKIVPGMWSLALSKSRLVTPTLRRSLFAACICENVVHIGDRITQKGLHSLISLAALARTLPSARFQGFQVSGSIAVGSNDRPGFNPFTPYARSPASHTIRFGEYSSTTSEHLVRYHLAAPSITNSKHTSRGCGTSLSMSASVVSSM